MRLFLSHATIDIDIAQAVRLRIKDLPEGPDCYLLHEDIVPAADWEVDIRAAARLCDAIVCIVTPAYFDRPWFFAEWAMFWFQEKPWYILQHEVQDGWLLSPMLRRQALDLADWRDMSRFFKSLAKEDDKTTNFDKLASEVVTEVQRVLTARANAAVEVHLAKFVSLLSSGTDNFDRQLVENIRRSGRLPNAVNIAINSENSVKIRQFAVILLDMSEFQDVARLAAAVQNRAERRTIAARAIQSLAKKTGQELLDIVLSIYSSVRNPQRRDIREAAESSGVIIDWPILPDAP